MENENNQDKFSYEWYEEVRKEYLDDYLEKIENRNKFLLTGAGGGILTILKFINLFKDNIWFQSSCWILLGLFCILGISTLFNYLYGGKASYRYIELYTETYKKHGEKDLNFKINENISLRDYLGNLESKNLSFKFFKMTNIVIEFLLFTIFIFIILIIISAVLTINKPKEVKNTMNKSIKKLILNGGKPKPGTSNPINDSFIPKAPPISRKGGGNSEK